MDLQPGQTVTIIDNDNRKRTVTATVLLAAVHGITGHDIVHCRYKDGRERYQYAYDIEGWTR